jgi:hypothetical protein
MMDNVDAISQLRQLRDSIDNIDAAIIQCWRSGSNVPAQLAD